MFRCHETSIVKVADFSSALEPLYALSNSLLLKSYESSDRDLRASGMELFTAVVTFMTRAPAGTINPLRQMQEGLGVWAWDPSRIVNVNVSHPLSPDQSLLTNSLRTVSTRTRQLKFGRSFFQQSNLFLAMIAKCCLISRLCCHADWKAGVRELLMPPSPPGMPRSENSHH